MPDRPPLSVGKKLLFSACLAAFTLIVAGGSLELGLRIVGFGRDPAFFRLWTAPDGSRWWRENRDFTLLYFPREIVRRPQPMRIAADKPASTYRVFVLGSSAAMGDPEASFSIARALEKMLAEAYPRVDFEIINAAVTAINSHVVRRIAADCASLSPDLFILYEGHNEVIGPFGPAAVIGSFARSSTAIRAATALRASRTGQLIEAMAHALGVSRIDRKSWGGMGMFLDATIAAADPRLEHTRSLFRENLEAIVRDGHESGARTVLCTVICNVRDFSPFRSEREGALPPDRAAAWETHWQAAERALAAGHAAAALDSLERCASIDPGHAETWFRLGRAQLTLGHDAAAATSLRRALDLDTLRFRTDSSLNEIIRDCGSEGLPGVDLLDLDQASARVASHHLPGDDLLYEHVHLNFQGTWLAARALFDRISQDLVDRGLIQTAKTPMPADLLRQRLAFSIYEQALIQRELLRRFESPPFSGKSDNAARIQRTHQLLSAADALLAAPENRQALEAVYQEALNVSPDDWVLHRNFGMALLALGDPARAIPHLERAAAWIDDDPDTLLSLAQAMEATGRNSEAETFYEKLRDLEPDYPGLP